MEVFFYPKSNFWPQVDDVGSTDTNGHTIAQWFKLSWQVGYHKSQTLAPSQTEQRLN